MSKVKYLKELFFLFVFSGLFVFIAQPSCSAIGVDWDSNIITAIGVGSAPEYAIKPGQANALARRAATVDAYRNLASIIYGIEVENHTTIEQLTVKNDTIKTAVEGAIRNARVVDEEQLDDSNYQVTVSMPLFGKNSLSSAVWQNNNENTGTTNNVPVVNSTVNPVQEPSTTSPTIPATMAATPSSTVVPLPTGAYTGLIVDCRGLGLERAMTPNIIDTSGRTLYNSQNVNNQQIIHNGLVSYVKSPNDEAANIAGSNPLILKCVSLTDFHRNPIISKEDGDRLISAVQQYDFLRNGSVVFIQ
ncbi:LPP20 family lipoprotein [Pectinatus frisingensis]|uniref:LPP20 family lipoprotein n=1 Tax=Pectinatus frisingensis TaxID=865 RepID=UPI0015F556D9|nr:LPP20 family lipoprotein [Pectinatus frisingensis]